IDTTQVLPEEAARFGVAEIGQDHRVVGFEEKPRHGNPVRSVFNPSMLSASMGVYIFNTDVLLQLLREDAEIPGSSHDFGTDVIPRCLRDRRVVAYDFVDINAKQSRYWRDVGTLDAIGSSGCIVSGGRVMRSVLSPGVRVHSYCEIEYSILMPNVQIGRYSRVRRAIIDTNVRVPESSVIGFDADEDRNNGYYIT